MKICLVGPGIMEIPPVGWGAVEILIWDYYLQLIEIGHIVNIINTSNQIDIINNIIEEKYDFVHIHYDCFYNIIPVIKKYTKKIAITSHYPYIDQPDKYDENYKNIFNFFIKNSDFYIFCISQKDANTFIKYCDVKENIYKIDNGANSKLFRFSYNPIKKERTICLGKIEERKQQYLISDIEEIDFIGNISDEKFKITKNYLGPYTKDQLYNCLTEYGNMVLLSNGEADPLVIKEGLMAGLGIVISSSMQSLYDTSLDFIDIIPENKMNDLDYIKDIINKNRNISISMRHKIREYAINNFSWEKIINKYSVVICNLCNIEKKYKICLIGPGIKEIPPVGWGAIESLVYDYYLNLKKKENEVYIINKNNIQYILEEINKIKPDIVHIMYDDYIDIAEYIHCKYIFYTSHWAYLIQEDILKNSAYFNIFIKVFQYKDKIHIFALSNEIKEIYVKYGFPRDKIIVQPNGAREDIFEYNKECLYPDRSIYLAKIDRRKSQYKYQYIENLYFAGNYEDALFNINHPNYLGEWSKDYLYKNLTNYANLVLLSDGEADPLVVKEAFMAGLGVVISEYSSANLDLNKKFITVIRKEDLNNIEYIKNKILENRIISINSREEIRNYGLSFGWTNLINNYLINIKNV